MLRNYVKQILNPILANTLKTSTRKYTPRRALLYVPADDLKKLYKTMVLDVDCIAFDCEDGVALNKKPQARLNIREMIEKGKPQKQRQYDLCVRVNALSSDIIKDDLSVIISGKHLPDTILLPKVERSDDLNIFSGYLNQFVEVKGRINLIMGIESADSLINIVNICQTAKTLAQTSKFKPVALLFGSDDYCASIGARRSESSSEIIYARQKIVMVAKAFNLQAIDMVYIKYKDVEGLKKQAEEGAHMGYTGKQIIHPGQVEITQNAFMPTKKEIAWARAVMKAFNEHQKKGEGAFIYKENMIDMPTMKQAQNIMDLVNAVMIQN